MRNIAGQEGLGTDDVEISKLGRLERPSQELHPISSGAELWYQERYVPQKAQNQPTISWLLAKRPVYR